jgi:prepilin-type N-terminal cleavage/methylation domain-containing protein
LKAPSNSNNPADDGFSLIELVVVVAIIPLIVGAIAVAILAVSSNQQSTGSSLTTSGDAQVSSVNFVPDIQSAVWITQHQMCGTVGTNLVTVSSDQVSSPAGIKNIVSYLEVVPVGASRGTLLRNTCTNSNFTNPHSEVLSHNLLASGSSLTVTPTPSPSNALSTGWLPTVGIQSVELVVKEPSTKTPGSATYSYALTAVPRARGALGTVGTFVPGGGGDTGANSPVQPILPVELLGPACPSLTLGGSGSIVNSGSGSGYVGFADSQTQCSNPTKGSPPGQIQSATPYVYGATDPFANLTPPAIPSPPSGGGGCTAGITITCTTGTYTASSTNFSGGTLKGSPNLNVTFDPSTQPSPNVIVFTVPVTIQNANVTFDGGPSLTSVTYVFEQGLTIATGSTVTFGAATYIFGGSGNAFSLGSQSTIAAPISSTGLLFYVEPGPATVGISGGTTGTILGSSSPYAGIALWDAASGLLTLGGNSGIATSFGGVYDPNGSVKLTGNSGVNAQFLIVNTATVDGGTTVTMTG